jgi:hypothetical protein
VTGGYLWMNGANSVANGGPFGNITPNAPGTDRVLSSPLLWRDSHSGQMAPIQFGLLRFSHRYAQDWLTDFQKGR